MIDIDDIADCLRGIKYVVCTRVTNKRSCMYCRHGGGEVLGITDVCDQNDWSEGCSSSHRNESGAYTGPDRFKWRN